MASIAPIESNGKANHSEPSEVRWTQYAEPRYYTAKDLAIALGTSDRNLLQKWLPKLLEAHHLDLTDLKDGELFTEDAFDMFSALQEAISPKVPKRDQHGEIIYSGGKPILIPNPSRIGFPAYRDRLAALRTADCDADGDLVAIAPVEEPEIVVVDAELDAELEDSLARLDGVGEQISQFSNLAKQFGAEFGQQLATEALSEAAKSFQETLQTGMAAMSGAMAPKNRRKK